MEFIYVLDIIGTFAFAVSGALVASDKKFDLFGVVIIAFVTAVGGGMLRDLLIDAHPINWIGDLNYMYTIFLAVIFTFLFKSKIAHLSKTMFLFDTVGLSVFTLLGLEKGLSFNLNPIIALILGWYFLNEHISGQSIIAAVVLLTGVYFINTKKKLALLSRFRK
jgi:uncharacterized membrane protein YeiH